MQTNTVLVVPSWVLSTIQFFERNWIAIIGILLIALIVCVITDLKKHKWNITYEEDKAKALVRWCIVASSAIFTAFGTLIYFVTSYKLPITDALEQMWPHVAQNVTEVLGVTWGLYNFRLNKTFVSIRAKLAIWSGSKKVGTVMTQADTLVQPEKPGLPTPPATEFNVDS